MRKYTLLRAAALLLAAHLLASFEIPTAAGRESPSESLAEAMDDSVVEHAKKHADSKYVCPMHPQIVRDEPGNCPICGMNLELKEMQTGAGGADTGPPIVTIRPETSQNMGVRTALTERGELQKRIESIGHIAYDEDRIVHLHSRTSGWVEKLLVRAEGDPVKRGQRLLEIYSPEFVNAQEEFLLALQGIEGGAGNRRDMSGAARRRLRLLEIPDNFVDTLAKTRQVRETIPVLATAGGVVTKIGVREGMYVKPEMELFSISDVSSVWVQVDVFEHQLDWIRVGQSARIQVAALPGRIWKGKVDYIYPELDPRTRTLKVRLRFDNADGVLKPNMFAQAIIYGRSKRNVLTIPREALIVSGGKERVVVALGEGRFQPRPVTAGMRVGERMEILTGLEEGDRVVVSGQFLIDSESNLQASFRRMTPLEDGGNHDH